MNLPSQLDNIDPNGVAVVRSEIDSVRVTDLVAEFGSPLFVFSEQTLRANYRAFSSVLCSNYAKSQIAWSYKTNYLAAVCAIFHQEGAFAEVVSAMEYEKARKLGVPGGRIIYNGPFKSKSSLADALQQGARIHADHGDELNDLAEIAQAAGPSSIGIRLNMDTESGARWQRFGFNLESGQALKAAERIASLEQLMLGGLHCHVGTAINEPRAYSIAVRKMLEFKYQLEERFDFRIEYLDIGGGFPSKVLHTDPNGLGNSWADFVAEIAQGLEGGLRNGDEPTLYLEPGRSLVDTAGFLITSVVGRKRFRDGRPAYVVDAGLNVLIKSWQDYQIQSGEDSSGRLLPSKIYGPMCMDIDVLAENVLLPSLHRGCPLVISPAGAYNVTQWMQFIASRPAVVLIGREGSIEQIREREDLSDIERRELLPDRLRNGLGESIA